MNSILWTKGQIKLTRTEEILLEGSSRSGSVVKQKARGLTSLHANCNQFISVENFKGFFC